MKRLLFVLALLPSLSFADRLGSFSPGSDVALSSQVVKNQNTLQSGATFYVSSGTVQGNEGLHLTGTGGSSNSRILSLFYPLPRSGGFGPQTQEAILYGLTNQDSSVAGNFYLVASTVGPSTTAPTTSTSGNYVQWFLNPLGGSAGTGAINLGVNGSTKFSVDATSATIFNGLRLPQFNCSGNANSGKLTANSNGDILCADDISGGGSGDGNLTNIATQPVNMGSYGINNIGTSSTNFTSGGGLIVNSTLTVNQGFYSSATVKTVNYTMTSTDTVVFASGSITVTLPASSNTNQVVRIVDTFISTAAVTVVTQSGLIAGTTNQVQMFAPGQNLTLESDGTNWWPLNSMPTTQRGIGSYMEPNSANVVVASTVYCYAEDAYDFFGLTHIAVDVGAQAGQSQFGAYDVAGNVISTTSKVTLGLGLNPNALAKVGYGRPGVVWLCGGSESATTSFTRKSSGSAHRGACSFTNGLPLPPKETFAGCTIPALTYTFFGYVGGSGIP